MTKLKYYREKLHLSADYVAGALGISTTEYISWENAGKAPISHLEKVAKIYGVKISELLGEVPAKSHDKIQIELLKQLKEKILSL